MPTPSFLARLLLPALQIKIAPVARFGLILLVVAAVALLRAAFVTDILPYLFFIPIILLSALVFGRNSGIVATLAAAVAAGCSMSPTGNPLSLSVAQWSAQGLFVLVNVGIGFLAAELSRSLVLLENLAEGRREAIHRLAAATAKHTRLASIVEQSQEFIGYADLEGRVQFVNESGKRLVGVADPRLTVVEDYFTEADRWRISAEILPAVHSHGAWTGEVEFRHFATGALIPVRYNVFSLRDGDADGAVVGYGTVTTDLRSQKLATAQREMLTRELAHRMKNTLSIVQAIVSQSLRASGSVAQARDVIAARLTALSRAQDILTATSWTQADIHDVVQAAIAPHRDEGARFVADGPHIDLDAQRALGLSLALHELATNAAKYGALSTAGGCVRMIWSLDEKIFRFEWIEQGGPEVHVPESRGFGSRLLERIVAAYFDGSGVLQFGQEGVRFVLEGELVSHPSSAEEA
ncbi:sensor histidine kinase [Mangrovibrevibacter kandeliae]|uniref:sensor histidine kinase n=1 Tax=Mangrovibrevibacter kandeliae TaxID=2968473 RepID=UPI002117AD97|nr:HWE histidine kinase domain-containing protein [Aurantimonas sp. CSK15Z-1]MCQ8782058.1 PAS domain S-box protein [Aurantimonas sp. CSK15Z-1]